MHELRIRDLESALHRIGTICAQLPPFEELDESLYDKLMDAIQGIARDAYASDAKGKQ